jgi:hypothetical protein
MVRGGRTAHATAGCIAAGHFDQQRRARAILEGRQKLVTILGVRLD